MPECEHPNRHACRNPYRVLCDDCGAEVFNGGYWPDGPIGETLPPRAEYVTAGVLGGVVRDYARAKGEERERLRRWIHREGIAAAEELL